MRERWIDSGYRTTKFEQLEFLFVCFAARFWNWFEGIQGTISRRIRMAVDDAGRKFVRGLAWALVIEAVAFALVYAVVCNVNWGR